MDSGIWHQVGLELSDIDVEGTVESKRGRQGGDDLSDESVQVGVGWSLDVQVSSANIVDGLIVKNDGDISMLKKGVSGQNRVVWLNNGGGDLWRGVHSEAELGFLTVVDGESLKEERSETGSGTTTDGVEDKETLKLSLIHI